MIVTKEHQEALVGNYVKERHNADECIGFIDGLNASLDLVKNLTIPVVSNQRELLIAFDVWQLDAPHEFIKYTPTQLVDKYLSNL